MITEIFMTEDILTVCCERKDTEWKDSLSNEKPSPFTWFDQEEKQIPSEKKDHLRPGIMLYQILR